MTTIKEEMRLGVLAARAVLEMWRRRGIQPASMTRPQILALIDETLPNRAHFDLLAMKAAEHFPNLDATTDEEIVGFMAGELRRTLVARSKGAP